MHNPLSTADAHEPIPAVGLLDDQGRLNADILCVRCQYNLRTLRANGICPECGGPVRATLQCALWYSDPGWVQGLAIGADNLFGAIVLAPLVLPAPILGLAGLWFLMRPEPLADDAPPALRARRCFFVALILSVTGLVLSGSLPSPLQDLGALAAALMFGSAFLLLGLHLHELAKRLMASDLARLSRRTIVAAVVLLTVLGLFVAGEIAWLRGWLFLPQYLELAGIGLGAAALWYMVSVAWCLARLRKALSSASRRAWELQREDPASRPNGK